MTYFLFATGIENSNPTIAGGRIRRDQMAECGHYDRWREDFALVQEIGCNFLRSARRCTRTLLGPGRHDWDYADQAFAELRRLRHRADRRPLPFRRAGLDRRLPEPRFPGAVRRLCPGLRRPLPLGAALHAGERDVHQRGLLRQYGWWNEQLRTDRGFVTALKHVVRANILAMQAILEVRPDAIFIQSEIDRILPRRKPRRDRPGRDPQRRALPHARPQLRPAGRRGMYEYLLDNGMTREEYDFFLSPSAQAPLHHGQRLLRHQRAPGRRRRPHRAPARSSATPRSPGNTTTATTCR